LKINIQKEVGLYPPVADQTVNIKSKGEIYIMTNYVEDIANEKEETLIELYRSFSSIPVKKLIDYGISEYVEDIGYHMNFEDKENIEFDSEGNLLNFHICDGEVKVIYTRYGKVRVKQLY